MKTVKKIGEIKIKINRKRLKIILDHLKRFSKDDLKEYKCVTKINYGFKPTIRSNEIEYIKDILLENLEKKKKDEVFEI